jgi:hypothetical protein
MLWKTVNYHSLFLIYVNSFYLNAKYQNLIAQKSLLFTDTRTHEFME